MKKPEPLALKASIPATESAIKVHGDEAAGARIILDLDFDELGQLHRLFDFRGKELLLVIQEA